MRISQATTPNDIAIARTLFQEYADDIHVDLCFQGFVDELARLPGSYGPPRGRLLISWEGETPAGCVALRPMNETICEMKRLFVRPALHGRGIGKELVNSIIREADVIGYVTMRLDTLPTLTAATQL
jgi:GNAT superfamily N-acetyltransferase